MKMAKASKADLDMAADLAGAFDALSNRWCPSMPTAVEQLEGDDDSEHFDCNDDEQCGRALRHLLDIVDRGSLFRVVMGLAVVLDPSNKCVDPDANTIEHHPDRARLVEALERLQRRGHLNESTCADEATNADLRFAAEALASAKGGAT